ncbi:acyltransferase family protein [Lysobacter solisilvae (ex Woo and Kim 2020)]|uniref:Acyltransferase n=1 Tax=Agrilutibacter terrestris TaxID=2865112 RepID=A0A7H0FXR6_9GAMM|nr:acyltransferase [Lysobacter terrestris]QNP40832.1 acyltransferase [Lysobacter terrestris]
MAVRASRRAFVTLADAVERRADNYLALRHLAALLVIYGHSYALSRNPDRAIDLVERLMPGFYAGSFAVYLFFAISGFLISLSLLRNPGVLRYVRNRLARVFPAYWISLLVCVFAFGLAYTTLSTGEYLRSAGTWAFVADNWLPITFTWHLPGVFDGNPLPKVVNGALWSLGLEVRWYAYFALLAALTVVRRRWLFTLLALALVLFGAWEWWTGKPDANHYRALSQTYLIAALCAHWRDRIPVAHWLMAAFVLLMALAHGSRWFGPATVAAAIYFTFWAAYALPALRWPEHRDYSYGLFLYGFPVQQALIASFPQIPPLALFPAATAGALVLAALSWHLVELPALQWKRRLQPQLAAAT